MRYRLNSLGNMTFAAAIAAGAALAVAAPAYALSGHEVHSNARRVATCDYNGRAWNDRLNADDQDPVLALRYEHAHHTRQCPGPAAK
jgi:hypothetical protein